MTVECPFCDKFQIGDEIGFGHLWDHVIKMKIVENSDQINLEKAETMYQLLMQEKTFEEPVVTDPMTRTKVEGD